MFLRRFAVPVLLACPVVLAAAAPASAGEPLAPGGSEVLAVPLPGTWAAQADQLGVSVLDLVQSENGCLPPEQKAGDTTCDADGGELAGQLVATVAAGTTTGAGCSADGAFVPLDLLHPATQSILAAVSGAQCLAVRLDFPSDADDNLAQSDGLTFDVRVVAEGPDGVSSPRSSTAGGSAGSADAAAAVQQPATNAQGGTPSQQVTGAIGAGTNATVAGAAGQVATDQGQAAAPDGEVLGEQTTTLDTDAGTDSVDVQTEAASRSTGELVVTYGSMFLGTVVLGLLLFLVWSRRRRRTVEGG